MIDVERYLRDKFGGGARITSRGEMNIRCPFHDDSRPSFSINIHTGLWICRSASCGLHGGFPLFYKLLEGIEDWQEVKSKLKISIAPPAKSFDELFGFSSSRVDSVLQYQDLPDKLFWVDIRERYPSWVASRGYVVKDLEGFDLKVGVGGVYRNCLIFPFYGWDGEILTYASRRMKDDFQYGESKYVYPPLCPKDQILYGSDQLRKTDHVEKIYIVEGPFDVLRLATFGEKALALSGCSMSDKQLLDIKKFCNLLSAEPIVLLDNDAHTSAVKIHYRLDSLGLKSEVLVPPDGMDPDNLDYEGFEELKNKFDFFSDLY